MSRSRRKELARECSTWYMYLNLRRVTYCKYKLFQVLCTTCHLCTCCHISFFTVENSCTKWAGLDIPAIQCFKEKETPTLKRSSGSYIGGICRRITIGEDAHFQPLHFDHAFSASRHEQYYLLLLFYYGRPMEYGDHIYFHAVVCSFFFFFFFFIA